LSCCEPSALILDKCVFLVLAPLPNLTESSSRIFENRERDRQTDRQTDRQRQREKDVLFWEAMRSKLQRGSYQEHDIRLRECAICRGCPC